MFLKEKVLKVPDNVDKLNLRRIRLGKDGEKRAERESRERPSIAAAVLYISVRTVLLCRAKVLECPGQQVVVTTTVTSPGLLPLLLMRNGRWTMDDG